MVKSLRIVLFLSVVLLAFPVRPARTADSGTLGIISAPLANVHAGPRSMARIETQVLMGDAVRILEEQDNRYHIVIPNQEDRSGWVQQEAVLIPKDGGRAFLNADHHWIVIATPKTDALILDKTVDHKVSLYAGTRLPVLETTEKGLKIQFPDKTAAIISGSDAMAVQPSDALLNDTSPESIARTAEQFIRVRYLPGGLSAQGMDMRGVIHIAYRIHGILIDTDAASFTETYVRVAQQDLEPGDILVFNSDALGLYLGRGKFLQASQKTGVRMTGFSGRTIRKSLRHGLRIIGGRLQDQETVAAMSADDILQAQTRVADLPLGKRIAYWAARFIGTPYDPDPLGLYVRTNAVIADEKADCMYHTFRSVELAQSNNPRDAVNRALRLRFKTRGKLEDGIVVNYDDRFQYGEDMVMSGKWGRNITAELGKIAQIEGSRGTETVDILPTSVLAASTLQKKLQDGDIVYWVKDPAKRVVGEIVAHISIIHVKSGEPYLIHASGVKDRKDRPGGGVVKEVPFAEYVKNTSFIGAFVTRFEE